MNPHRQFCAQPVQSQASSAEIGENAYGARINISHTANLRLSSLHVKDNSDIRIVCSSEDRLRLQRLCNVSAPFMRAKSKVYFRLEFEFSRSVVLDHLHIFLEASSDGEDVSTADNYNDMYYFLQYEADLLFTRSSNPTRYEIKSDLSLEDSGVMGPPFNFTFQVQNLGYFPVRDLQLNIEIPEMTRNGNQILQIHHFSIDQRDGTLCLPPQHVAQSRAAAEDLSRYTRLNRSNTLPVPLQCSLNVASYSNIAVRISGALRVDTLHALRFRTVEVVSSAWVQLPQSSAMFLQEERPLRHIVLEIRKAGDSRVPTWIIVGSTLGGLLLLALLILALWKLGFFRRQKQRDEDQPMGKVSEEERSFSARKYVKRKQEDSGEEARSRVQKTEEAQTWLDAAERYILSVLDGTDLPISASTQVPFTDGNASLAAQLHLTSSDEEVEKKPEESAFHCDKSKPSCDISGKGHETSLCDHKQTCGLEVSQQALTGDSDLKVHKGKRGCFCEICKNDLKFNSEPRVMFSDENESLAAQLQVSSSEEEEEEEEEGPGDSGEQQTGDVAGQYILRTMDGPDLGTEPDSAISASTQVPFTDGNASLAAQLHLTSSDEEVEKKTEESAFHCDKSKPSCDISGEGHSLCDHKQTCGQEVSQQALTGDSDLKIHKGKRGCFCEICKKDLKFNCHLKKHKMTHSVERPYSCDSCEKRYSQRSHLKRHMKTHKRENPFSCLGSGRSFSACKYVKRKQEDSGEECRSRVQKTEESQTWLEATDLPISASAQVPFTDGNESLAALLHLTSNDEEVEKKLEESTFLCDKSKELKHCCDMTGEGHKPESSLRDHKQTCGLEVSQRALSGDSDLKILKRKRWMKSPRAVVRVL
uniref:C2H2-type domain-containing protein n=1 Tax=Knipowitschia caucasica TaxID=637954 RepID=A0AAV2LUD8_KNICA